MSPNAIPADSGAFPDHFNDEDAGRNRTRVSRACTRCRTRKDRCDGQRPQCSTCLNAGKSCIYEPTTKKRGLPEGYVRGLEKLLALSMRQIDGLEDAFSNLLAHDSVKRNWNCAAAEELHSSWKESRILQEIEAMLLDQPAATVPGQKRKRDSNEDENGDEGDTLLLSGMEAQYHVSTGPPRPASANRPSAVTVAVLPANARQLLDHYFLHTHCWFPVVSRPQVLRSFYKLSTSTTQKEVERGNLALLWAMLAYTTAHDVNGILTQANARPAEELQKIAFTHIPTDSEEHTTTHAQALLILAMLDLGKRNWKTASILVGNAVRIILASSPGNGAFGMVNKGLIQGCFIVDVAVAIHMKSVPHLQPEQIRASGFMQEDGHEEWEPWGSSSVQYDQQEPAFSISTFNRLTQIYMIIAESLSGPKQNRDDLFIRKQLETLHQLYLPSSPNSPPHRVYLQIAHVSAQVLLVESSVLVGAGALHKAKLACNYLSLLGTCSNTPYIGLHNIPPFFADGLQEAIRGATEATSAFGPSSALPAYEEFCSAASTYVRTLAVAWPVFESCISPLNQPGRRPTSNGRRPQFHSPPAFGNGTPSIPSIPTMGTRHLSGSSPHEYVDPTHRLSNAQRSPQRPRYDRSIGSFDIWGQQQIHPEPSVTSASSAVHDFNLSSATYPTEDSAPTTVDSGMQNMDTLMPIGLAIPATSPSFEGDEIDAIFHEMAHLDTNEWTNERALGLKDFGFNDDLTFQAFCNDPERLATPYNTGGAPLSSNRQTWTFTEHAQ